MNQAAAIAAVAALILCGCSRPPTPKPAALPQSTLRITQFYASPPKVAKGEKSLLCYGVEGATSVKLDPGARALSPALTRCVESNADSTTTFTLTAEDGKGASKQATATVEFGAARVRIQSVTISALSIHAGDVVNVCYEVRNAVSVDVAPARKVTGTRDRSCFTDQPRQTTTYKVIAHGAGGETDTEQVTVKVANP
ncbi:MAG: hypothetical protein ABI823_18800 [Bryobacteraceae bacterium]